MWKLRGFLLLEVNGNDKNTSSVVCCNLNVHSTNNGDKVAPQRSILLIEGNGKEGGGRRGGLLVSGPGSSPGRRHCVVLLGKTLYSHSASLHPGV